MNLYFYSQWMFDEGSYTVNNGNGTFFFYDAFNEDAFYLLKNYTVFKYLNSHGDYNLDETISDVTETLLLITGSSQLVFSTYNDQSFTVYDDDYLSFYCDSPFITNSNNTSTVNGIPIINNSGLPIFEQLNNAVDYIFFNGENPNTVLFETKGTLFDFQITTSTITYALSITAIILSAVGVAMFIKGIFNLIRGK